MMLFILNLPLALGLWWKEGKEGGREGRKEEGKEGGREGRRKGRKESRFLPSG
jgi:hypothetical protein